MSTCESGISQAWAITIGTTPGYGTDLQGQKQMSEEEFAAAYMAAAKKVFDETGVYVSATMAPVKVLYNEEWGCPAGGEFAYRLTGIRNPKFSDITSYGNALDELTRNLKELLGQTTVTLEVYDDVGWMYYTSSQM